LALDLYDLHVVGDRALDMALDAFSLLDDPKKKGKGKGKEKCGKGKRPYGGGCIPTTSCCSAELSGENECDPCARQTCVNGACQCDPSLINHNGACGVFLNCLSVSVLCTSDFDRCSDQCMPVGNGQARCIPGTQNCLTDFDCVSGNCRGFLCPELYQSLTGGGC
jgi:hypothetical protein